MNLIRIVVILFLVTGYWSLVTVANASDYYVSPTGSDSNPGTVAQPFLTIQKGIDQTIAGDHVKVLPGTYIQSDNYLYGQAAQFINRHGTPDNNIVLEAADPAHKPILRGYSGVRVGASSYITINNLIIEDTTHSSLPVYLSDHITLTNNVLRLRFDHLCTIEENQQGFCNYYPSKNLGEIVGRVDKNGQPIREHDGSQNTGVYVCKSVDITISGNTFANYDESIYVGNAGNVGDFDCWLPTHAIPGRLYNERLTIQDNLIENSWNEAIELKPDTRFNHISGNVTLSTRPHIETSQLEIRGHDNEVDHNIIVGAPNLGIRVLSESVSDPGPDRVEAYKKADGSYMSAYRNHLHHNYIYSWSQYNPNNYGIGMDQSTAANIIDHNTLVGINEFTGAVNEYSSIKANSYPETIVKNNLMVGTRRYDYTPGSTKYEHHLLTYANTLPQMSDYNAYFPRLKTNNQTCVVSVGNLGIVCQNLDPHNQSVGYEYHSQFLDSSPLSFASPDCDKTTLLSLPITSLKERILACSQPVAGSPIIGAASDGTTIGAWQTSAAPPPLSGDLNQDSVVDFRDFLYLLSRFHQPYTIFNFNSLINSLGY